jgi:hypothetical protein
MLYNMKNRNYGQEHQWHMTRDKLLATVIGTALIAFGAYTAAYVHPAGVLLLMIGLAGVITANVLD